MTEEDLQQLLKENKTLKLVKLNEAILKTIKSAVNEYVIRVRGYGMAEVFTKERFNQIEHLLECNYLMNVLNMNTNYGISRIVRFNDSMLYYAELVSGKALLIKFINSRENNAVHFDNNKISDALNVLTFPYKFLQLLSKNDRLAADKFLRKYAGGKKPNQTLPIYNRIPKADYIKELKKIINELKNTPPGKVDKSKVAKKKGIAVNTLNDDLSNHEIKYHKKTKLFEDLETGELF